MKVGEARGIYSSVLKSYNQQKFKLSKQRNELKERMESTPDGKTLYADEAATLDLQYNAVAEKQDEYQDYVDQLMEQWESKFNSVAAKQQDEAAKDYSEEMGKIMTVATANLITAPTASRQTRQADNAKRIRRYGMRRKRKRVRIQWKQLMQRKHLQPDRRLCRWNRLWRQRLGRWSRNKSKWTFKLVKIVLK